MKFILTFTVTSILLLQPALSIPVFARQPKVKSFTKWCQQRKSVPASTRHTINLLLEIAGTNNCQQANLKLRYISKKIKLDESEIVDLSPLASFVDLRELYLRDNKIVDLKPLMNLTKLVFIDLTRNKITDISPCPD
jgi:internalin A